MNKIQKVKKQALLYIILGMLILNGGEAYPQTQALRFSLEEVIHLAKEQSPMAIMSKHRFRGSYWEFRTHKAKFRPGLDLSTNLVDLNRSIERITLPDGSDAYVPRSQITYGGTASLTQNIAPTGGSIFMTSSFERIDLLSEDDPLTSYLFAPVSIGFRQPIKDHNSFRWERKIEPLKFQTAEKEYIESLETVSQRAVDYFFNLALAQVNLQIAELNYSNNDTLFKIATGRYNIGTIAENELLEMELAFLNAGTALNESRINLEIRKFQLRSFLGYNDNIDIELIIPGEIPEMEVEVAMALEQAHNNSPTIIDLQRQLLEADKNVAEAKSQRGFTADLYATFGLTRQSDQLSSITRDFQDQERVRVGLDVPIVDWGLAKGQHRMAQSNQEVVRTNVQQDKIDFDQEVMLQVMQFNIQDDQLRIASKADTIAQLRYNVTKERFYIGRINVFELNIALRERDDATRNYLSTLHKYWSYYYNIRRLTLYDFQRMIPLVEDFNALIQ